MLIVTTTNLNIKLFRNEKNIGAFGNKLLNIKNCSNDVVYQIDSDNVTDTNLDLVINQVNDKNIIYLPSKFINSENIKISQNYFLSLEKNISNFFRF